MEVQFTEEVAQLRLGAGQVFHGEGILAITKALLQSGVAYVGGYQGAPVSHLLDVMVQARDYMNELGVHVEACSNEASAAAMLGASLHYPRARRGHVEVDRRHQRRGGCVVEPFVAGRGRWRADRVGRGLRRRRQRDPGTHARLRDEEHAAAAGPTARPRGDGADGRTRPSRCRKRRTCRRCFNCAFAPATCAAASCARTTWRPRCRRCTRCKSRRPSPTPSSRTRR